MDRGASDRECVDTVEGYFESVAMVLPGFDARSAQTLATEQTQARDNSHHASRTSPFVIDGVQMWRHPMSSLPSENEGKDSPLILSDPREL